MFFYKKYDIAFSVSEFDIAKAVELYRLLEKKNIRCYLYSEDKLPTLSRNLFQETLNIYNKRSWHVLVLGSKHFGKGSWTSIEGKIIDLTRNKRRDYLILVKLDDTEMGWAENIGYLQYKGNWHEVVDYIVAIVKTGKKRRRLNCLLLLFFIGLLGITTHITINDVDNRNQHTIPDDAKKADSLSSRKKHDTIKPGPIVVTPWKHSNKSMITVTGLVKDEGENLLDSVLVTVNNTIGYTSSGKYQMQLEYEMNPLEMNSISLGFEFTKKGYKPEIVNLTKDVTRKNMVFVIDKVVLKK